MGEYGHAENGGVEGRDVFGRTGGACEGDGSHAEGRRFVCEVGVRDGVSVCVSFSVSFCVGVCLCECECEGE